MKNYSIFVLALALLLNSCAVGCLDIYYAISNHNDYPTSIFISENNSIDNLRTIAQNKFTTDCKTENISDYIHYKTSADYKYIMFGIVGNQSNISYLIARSGVTKFTINANAWADGYFSLATNRFYIEDTGWKDTLFIELSNDIIIN